MLETIDQFAYKFGLTFKSDFGEDYTVAMFEKSLPNEYRERLMGVNIDKPDKIPFIGGE